MTTEDVAPESSDDGRDHRGGCSCGWRGPWRLAAVDANLDIQHHYEQTNHKPTTFEYHEVEPADDEDLMPFERAKLRKQE